MSKVTNPTRLRGPLAIFEFLRTKLWLNNFLLSIRKGSLGYKIDRGRENVLCTKHSAFDYCIEFKPELTFPIPKMSLTMLKRGKNENAFLLMAFKLVLTPLGVFGCAQYLLQSNFMTY